MLFLKVINIINRVYEIQPQIPEKPDLILTMSFALDDNISMALTEEAEEKIESLEQKLKIATRKVFPIIFFFKS